MQNCHYIIFFYLLFNLWFYKRTVTRFIADAKLVYQRMRRETRLASDNSWAWHRLKHLSWRLRWIIRCTLEWECQFHAISRVDMCVFGLSSIATRRTRSTAAWLPDWHYVLHQFCGFSSADYRCFQVSNSSQKVHSTAFMHHTALTGRDFFNQNRIFLWNSHNFV